MAVEIDLDLDASNATGKIGAVAASLKGLERVANDIEIDFDADIGDITDEIENFADALEGISVDTDSLLNDFNEAVEKMEDAEVELGINMPDGETGSGDSVGDDPPENIVHKLTDIGGISTQATKAATATDGGERANRFDRIYGPDHTLMSESDIGNLFKTRSSRESNLGEHASSFPGVPHEMMQVGTRTGFGLDPESMNLRRLADDISIEEFQHAGVVDSKIPKLKARRLRKEIAGLYDGDILNQADLDPLGMKTPRRKQMENLRNVETGLTEGDMERAIGKQTDFGMEPISMIKRRRTEFEGVELENLKQSDIVPEEVDVNVDKLQREIAELHGGDFLNIEDDFERGDMDRAVAKAGDFGTEPLSMMKKRRAELEEVEIQGLAEIDPGFDDGVDIDKKKLQADLADLYGGDFLNQADLDPLGMKPDVGGAELGGGDMEAAVAERGEFGTEPLSMMKKRREMLDEMDLEDISLNYDVGGDVFDDDKPGSNLDSAPGLDFSVGGGRDGRSNVDLIDNNRVLSKVDSIRSASDAFGVLGDVQSGFGKKLRKLKPTMGKYMQLLAALIPVALALGTQLLGVAAAMGSVAVAGGAIMGLGLLGHAESMSGSFAEAKAQLRELKKEMFQAAQPTMQQFAPIQARMFDAIPEGLDSVFDAMEGLTAFEDTLFELGGALAGGMEQAVDIIVENEAAISNLSTTFGGLIGSGLLNFFEWLIQAASENKQLLIGLGQDMIKLAVAAYNVSMAIAQVLTAFTPLFDLLVFISEVLNSQIIIGLITMVGWLYVLGKAAGLIYSLYAGFLTLASGIADAALMMFGYEMSTWGAVAATLALVAAIGLLTLGAATVIGGAVTAGAMGATDTPGGPGGGGGAGGPSGGGGGGKVIYNDNRSYEINNSGGDDYASQKRMENTVKRVNETEQAQSLPDVETSSETSDGGP
jgi:hypothetical protein